MYSVCILLYGIESGRCRLSFLVVPPDGSDRPFLPLPSFQVDDRLLFVFESFLYKPKTSMKNVSYLRNNIR
jgi:hypothetical protein